MTREFHPVADIFPLMDAEAFSSLCSDIEANGLREPIWLHEGQVIDGRNRYRACVETGTPPAFRDYEGTADDLLAFVLSLNLERRHLTSSQRAVLALTVEAYEAKAAKARQGTRSDIPETIPEGYSGGEAREKAAATVGTNSRYVSDAKRIQADAPELLTLVSAGTLTIPDAKKLSKLPGGERADVVRRVITGEAKNIKQAKRDRMAEAKVFEPVTVTEMPDACRLITASLTDADVEPESIECIITDPPYPREYVGLYGDLAQFAARTLKPGGSLVAMAGQSYLPEILDAMRGAGLTYQWTLAYLTPGGQAVQLWQRKVNTFWKPLLWFTKDQYAGDWIGDVTRSETNDNDKRFHHWGQSESGMSDVVNRFSYPGDTICDPFVGGGTTAVVALDMGRRFVGVDVDPNAIATTRARIAEIHAA